MENYVAGKTANTFIGRRGFSRHLHTENTALPSGCRLGVRHMASVIKTAAAVCSVPLKTSVAGAQLVQRWRRQLLWHAQRRAWTHNKRLQKPAPGVTSATS
jgi:hypothetical protein